MSNSPKSPFNLASGAWGKNENHQQDQGQGPDKDNAASRFDPPNNSQNPAPNLAPPGMGGGSGRGSGSGNDPEKNNQEPESKNEIHITFTPEDASNSRKVDLSKTHETTEIAFSDGKHTALIDHSYEKNPNGGEDIGKISRLSIADENGEGPEFKNGAWKNKPITEKEEENVRLCEQQFGKLDHQKFKSFDDLSESQEHGRDI